MAAWPPVSGLPPMVHRTIVWVDVAGFTARPRTTAQQVAIREGMYHSLKAAFDGSGVPWEGCYREDRGDGVLVLAPSDAPKTVLASRMPRLVAAAVAEHNRRHGRQEQFRLRMAMHAGEIQHDQHGVTAPALNLAARLLDAAPLRQALADSAGVLAVITSEWFYDEVVAHTQACEPATYRHVHVAEKDTRTTAWLCRPDDPFPPQQQAEPDVPGPARRSPPRSPTRFPARFPARSAGDTARPVTAAWLPRDAIRRPAPAPPSERSAVRAVLGPHRDARQAGPTLCRKALGARLRRLRTERGLTRADAASAIGASESKIRRIEVGQGGCKPRDVANLLTFYGVTDATVQADSLALAQQTYESGWVDAYSDILPSTAKECLELEQAAILIRGYQPAVIPRLLQTPEYARAMLLRNPDIAASRVERWVDLLIDSQRILHIAEPPHLWMTLDEAALRGAGDIDALTMRRQLQHLIDLAEQRHIAIQILPTGTATTAGAFTIVRLPTPELRHIASLGQPTPTSYLDDPDDIARYLQVMHQLVVHATAPDESIGLLRCTLNAT